MSVHYDRVLQGQVTKALKSMADVAALVRWASLLLGLGTAIAASQPLGRLAQQHVTTSADLAGVRLADVQRQEFAGFISHKVTLGRG